MPKRQAQTLSVQRDITVQLDTADSREETFLGRVYLVVPVVAMIEGVRFGANQSEPELGLAAEFGGQPILWANRPLVLNHPQVDGIFVSANSPQILEEYFVGLTMNPIVDGSKLKMEAWIDVVRCEELGGEAQELLDRIEADEVIEVSVGFFSDLEPRKGKFNGQVYGAVWRNIRPDHLAILSAGTIGACSIKDGCGMPRINTKPDVDSQLKTQCSCGGHEESSQAVSVNETDDKIEVVINKTPKKAAKGSVPSVNTVQEVEELTPEQETEQHRQRTQVLVDQYLSTQKVDDTLLSTDVSKMINRALRMKYGSDAYLYGFTNQVAVFEVYDFDLGFNMKQIEVNVTADKVDFVGEPKDVILLTRIVPQESNMPNEDKTKVQGNASPEANATTTESAQPEGGTEQQEQTPQVQTAPLSVQEYIDQAPEGMRDVLSASLKVHEEKKATAIKALVDSKQCKFSDEFLKAQSLENLENMVALLPGTYNGVAAPSNPQVQAGNSNETVPAPRVFAKKSATTEAA